MREQVGVLAGGFSAFRIGAALSVVGFPQVPALKGPFQRVGVKYTRVRGEKGRSCRVKIFYPAEGRADTAEAGAGTAEAGPKSGEEAPYCTDGRQTSDGMAGLVGFRQAGLSFLLAHLADAPSGLYPFMGAVYLCSCWMYLHLCEHCFYLR